MKKQLMSFVSFSFAVLCTGCATTGGNTGDNPLDPKNEITRERAGEIQENWWAQFKQSEHTETYEAHVKYYGMYQSQSGTYVADYIGVKSSDTEFQFTYKEGSYNASESTLPVEYAIGGIGGLMIGGGFDIAEMALRNENAKFYFDGTNFTCYTSRVEYDYGNKQYYTEETVSKMNSIGFLLYKDIKNTYTNDNIVFSQYTFYASYKVVQ